MKKTISLLLALVLCLSLCACGGGNNTVETTVPTEPPTAREQLTELEEKLFNNLIAITKDSFYEPSAVRVLEVCDYYEGTTRTDPDEYDYSYGPDRVVVRLQGENRVGGTVNHYYLICLTGAENTSEYAKTMIAAFARNKEMRMHFKAEEGEYAEIGDYYEVKRDSSDIFDIGRINRALKEYWEEMGF